MSAKRRNGRKDKKNKKQINDQLVQKDVKTHTVNTVAKKKLSEKSISPELKKEAGNAQKIQKHKRKSKVRRRAHVLYGLGFLGAIIVCIACGAYYYYAHQNTIVYERKLQSEQYAQVMQKFEADNVQEVVTIQERIPTDAWKKFTSQYYGFEIAYPPEGWTAHAHKVNPTQTQAIYRVDFLKHSDVYNEPVGYSVAVYDTTKTKELKHTDEFPKMKNNDLAIAGLCAVPSGHMFETGDYPAEEVYVPSTDECYESALLFTTVKGQYIYNITPIVNMRARESGVDPMVSAVDVTPEFFAAVTRFANIEIVRPKPKPAVVRSSAPMPATYKKDHLGRLVCEKKNDKPSKSKKNNKGKMHLDMECCLDPDEYPNPHCYYDPGKYGKYMK